MRRRNDGVGSDGRREVVVKLHQCLIVHQVITCTDLTWLSTIRHSPLEPSSPSPRPAHMSQLTSTSTKKSLSLLTSSLSLSAITRSIRPGSIPQYVLRRSSGNGSGCVIVRQRREASSSSSGSGRTEVEKISSTGNRSVGHRDTGRSGTGHQQQHGRDERRMLRSSGMVSGGHHHSITLRSWLLC